MNTSTESLHKFVKLQVEEKALAYLNMMKLKHSKVLHIRHESLKIQEYLMPENVKSIEMSTFLLNARCRMLEVGANFPNMFERTPKCKLGCDTMDTQEHLLDCPHLAGTDLVDINYDTKYSDLFSNRVEEQLRIAAILKAKLQRRKQIVKEK